MFLAIPDDMLEASPNLGRKLLVELLDAFLAVAEDDSRARQVS